MRHGVDAGAIGGVHRMQRLDRERHTRGMRVFTQLADAEHEARRAEFQSFVDGTFVVIERGAASRAVGGRKHAAATIAGEAQTRVANVLRRFLETRCRDLIAPWRYVANAVVRASGDYLGQRPLLAQRGRVDRQQFGVGRAHLIASMPWNCSNVRMRAQASSGSPSTPATSASWNNSTRCVRFRALCWPPTMTKCFWWPLSHARKTTPVL